MEPEAEPSYTPVRMKAMYVLQSKRRFIRDITQCVVIALRNHSQPKTGTGPHVSPRTREDVRKQKLYY